MAESSNNRNVTREEFDGLKNQMSEMISMMKEQMRLTQDSTANNMESEKEKKEEEESNEKSGNDIFNFGAAHKKGGEEKEVIKIKDDSGNSSWIEKIQSLEDTVRAMKGKTAYGGVTYEDLCIFPSVEYPKKFKNPDFEKYAGIGDPYTHLKTYMGDLGMYGNDEKLRVQLFQKSLTGIAKTWFTRLDKSKITCWEDLANAFVKQYGFQAMMVPDIFQLMKIKKKPGESFREYAQKWSELASQVDPPLSEKDMVKYFIETQEAPYYEWVARMDDKEFAEIIRQGEKLEEGIRSGKLVDATALKEAAEQIQSGNYQKKNNFKKKEGDVSVVLQGGGQQPNTNNAGQVNPVQRNFQQETRRTFPNNRNRIFTPLADSLENIFSLLINQRKITQLLPAPPTWGRNYDATKKCEYHSGGAGHSIENCWALKHRIQDLIDAKEIMVSVPGEPNIQTNPLPKHEGSQINVLEVEGDDQPQTKLVTPLIDWTVVEIPDYLNLLNLNDCAIIEKDVLIEAMNEEIMELN